MARVPEEVIRLVDPIDAFAVILFGSHAEGAEHERSDIDVCLVAGPGADVGAIEERALRHTTPSMDVKVFETMPLWLKGEVLDRGMIVHARDHDALQEYLWRFRRVWDDEKRRATPTPDDIERIFRARGHA